MTPAAILEATKSAALPCYRRIAVFGGVYSNHLALAEAIRDATERGAEALYCLGDLGAFGPNPDINRTMPKA